MLQSAQSLLAGIALTCLLLTLLQVRSVQLVVCWDVLVWLPCDVVHRQRAATACEEGAWGAEKGQGDRGSTRGREAGAVGRGAASEGPEGGPDMPFVHFWGGLGMPFVYLRALS